MKTVTFYIVKYCSLSNYVNSIDSLLCHLSRRYWYQGKRILIYCKSKLQAIHIDNLLWEQPVNTFIPHNIVGEVIDGESPIEISWIKNEISLTSYNVLVNLLFDFPSCFFHFKEIVDFVPYEENYLKESGRIRYKKYRKFGFKINIIIL
ncbi:DNA polymerase III subunit chi [Pantoea sp. SoEX]|uniref:DNA polymerase III subunit chi n=1 Tax=Pantoea sp. SoEX TaxID=2576763 RepID=UPI00135C5D8D|nr:DNA polymerase III subunit chi [Pantoea sp. SoEX]MXP51112.1 DNA polymerase III subunit chi [Pantoea sp. SoEX]